MKQSLGMRISRYGIYILLLSSVVFSLLGLDAPVSHAEGATYSPYIDTDLAGNYVTGKDWPLGNSVTLTVDDPATLLSPDFSETDVSHPASWDPNTAITEYALDGKITLKPGYVLVMTDGVVTTAPLILLDVRVTSVDINLDVVSGFAPPDMQVNVNSFTNNGHRHTTAGIDGSWSVNFSVVGTQPDEQTIVDILGGTGGYVNVQSTATFWRARLPFIQIQPDDYWVQAVDWPLGALLTMTIHLPGLDYSSQAYSQKFKYNDRVYAAYFDLPQSVHLQPGDIVTITDGITRKSYAVLPLRARQIDLEADTISGVAVPGSPVQIWVAPDSEHGFVFRHVVADANGYWLANFHIPGILPDEAETVDLQYTDYGQATDQNGIARGYESIWDGDTTWIDWYVPNITASLRDQRILWQTLLYGNVTITIDDLDTTQIPDFTTTVYNDPQAGFRNGINYQSSYNFSAGDTITVSDGFTTKSLIVSDIQVSTIDIQADTFSGTATPGTEVQVCINFSDHCAARYVTADSSGNWTADYQHAGSRSDENEVVDIQAGTYGWAEERDHDGDITRADWQAPNPMICVNLNYDHQDDSIWSMGWPLNAMVNLNIDDPGTSQNPDYTSTQIGEPASWAPSTTVAWFKLQGIYNIQPGYLVSVSAGTLIKTMNADLSVSNIDIFANTVSGMAGPWTQVNVTAGDASRHVIADFAGHWSANFAHVGTLEDEQTVFDIVSGTTGIADQWDEDGDCINFRWRAPDNQPPVISGLSAPLNPVQLGQSINATAIFSDPDIGDTHSFTWVWGDGSITTGSSASTSHLYAQSGVYTISVTVTDTAGESANFTSQQYVVIYDPNGGFVTGGGWINSPAGAYTANPTLTGKATFGFVSQYKKGANVPTGNTEFQFKMADLNFKSTSYDWLVVAGTKAQFKGTGTINGAGNYGFMLTAIDGTPDKFRIKIWDKATGAVVYDNQLDATDTADPTTVLGGGSIVIHK